MVSASSAAASQLAISPRQTTEPKASTAPNERASLGVTCPRGIGRAAVRAIAASISASYHMLSAPDGAGAGGNADQRGDGQHGMHRARRRHHPDQRGEHHEEHHPRLHQRDIVGDVAAGIGSSAVVVTGYATSVMPSLLTHVRCHPDAPNVAATVLI